MFIQRQQSGWSTYTLMLVIGLAGFFLTLFFKMGPAYLEHSGLKSAMSSMVRSTPDLHGMSKGAIRTQMSKYYTINNVREHNVKDLDIKKSRDRTLVTYVYEARVPVFFNVDVVMSFKSQIDSTNIEACCKYLVDVEK